MLSKFVNKAADGGITALHMAALNGYFDCVQLLLDLHANVSAVTFHYGTSMDLIGTSCQFLIVEEYLVANYFAVVLLTKLKYLNRSRQYSTALCSLWWKPEMLPGKNYVLYS